jgi:hypothetical protein
MKRRALGSSALQIGDILAIVLLLGAAAAFWFGSIALSRSDDLKALYWLFIGVFALRASVQVVRPGAKP